MNRKKIQFFALLLVLLLSYGCNDSTKAKRLKLAHGLDTKTSVHQAMLFMAKRVDEISGGKLQVDIYPSGQLGGEQQCIELLQIGSLAMTKVSSAVMEGFNEDFKVFGLPYVFMSKEHSFNVLDGPIGDEMLLSSEKYNIRGMCFYDAGSRSFYTINKPINTPEDVKGLKMRVMKSPTAVSMMKEFDASPTPISWGELYTALQSGVVDGAENNPPSFYLSHHYEVCKYYTLNEHTALPDVMIMSKPIWDKLTKEEQGWLSQAIKESVPVQRKLWAESVAESLAAVEKAGVTVIRPDKTLFAEKVSGVYEQYRDNEHLWGLLQKIAAANPDKKAE